MSAAHEPASASLGGTQATADGDESAASVEELESTVEALRTAHEALAAQNEELRAAKDLFERRYEELFELSPVGYVLTDTQGVVREANRAAAELLARELRFLVGKPFAALVGPERRPAFHALTREAAGGARWHDEIPFLHSDGGRVRLLVSALGPAPGTDDSIRWSLADAAPASALAHPTREELVAAQTLQRQRLSRLLDRLHHGVATVGPSLRITYANTAAAKLLARGESPVGRTLVDPWPEPSLCDLAARMFEHGAGPAEGRVSLADGRRAYEVLALPPDASGDALLLIADVTTHERQHRAEREFVANAAHQLRTPVAGIASAIEVLQGGAKETPEARDRFLAHLDRECARLVRLTRALLVLARAQALAEAPAVEIVPLHPLLVSIARALRPAAGVEIRVNCPSDVAALTNRDLLEQAVGNLAENAVKYTPAGEIVICAERVRGRKVRVVVSDTGPGGSFGEGSSRRFYRDPGAQGEGFGLGLAIAEETVRALGGDLEIESGNDGTRAVITLAAATVRPA